MNDALQLARNILAALPLYAQGVAGRYGVRVVFDPRITTPMTDGKTIKMPPLPLPAKADDAPAAERLAILAKGFIDHEVGHVRHTTFELPDLSDMTQLLKSLWNAIEDPRQELLLIGEFPGVRTTLDRMTESLIGTPTHYRVLEPDMEVNWLISAYTLYTLRADLRGQAPFGELAEQSRPAMVAVFGEAFVARLEVICATTGMNLRSTADALDMSREIVKAMEEEHDAQQPPPEQPKGDEGEEGGAEEESGDGQQGSNRGESGSKTDAGDPGDESGESDGADGSTGGAAKEADESASHAGGCASGNGNGGEPTPEQIAQALDKALRGNGGDGVQDLGDSAAKEIAQRAQEITDHGTEGRIHDAPQVIDMEKAGQPIEPLTSGSFDATAALLQSGRLRALLQNELRALQRQRTFEVGRGSSFNDRKAYRTSTGDRRLFLKTEERRELNTAVFILGDVSSSMSNGGKIGVATEALFATASAMEAVRGVTTAVGTFPGFGRVLGFGESVRCKADSFALHPHGCTPMAEGILWASRQLVSRKEDRKILLVVTDGMPDCVGTTKAQIAAAEAAGIEVMALGIQLPMVATLFAKAAVIQSIGEITPAMMSMLRGALLGQLAAA